MDSGRSLGVTEGQRIEWTLYQDHRIKMLSNHFLFYTSPSLKHLLWTGSGTLALEETQSLTSDL